MSEDKVDPYRPTKMTLTQRTDQRRFINQLGKDTEGTPNTNSLTAADNSQSSKG